MNMAKARNVEVTGGLTTGLKFGAAEAARAVDAAASSKPVTEPKVETPASKESNEPTQAADMVNEYAKMRKSRISSRSVRLSITITPEMHMKLDELLKNGEIDSKNDLVNFLLNSYFADREAANKRN